MLIEVRDPRSEKQKAFLWDATIVVGEAAQQAARAFHYHHTFSIRGARLQRSDEVVMGNERLLRDELGKLIVDGGKIVLELTWAGGTV